MLIKTPCIGVCSTIYGDTVCRGCRRHDNEIIQWNQLHNNQKLIILSRLEKLMVAVVSRYLDVTDADLLQEKCKELAIRYYPTFPPVCWAYNILRTSADKISDISSYGICIRPEFAALSLPQLFQTIDDVLYTEAQAHKDAQIETQTEAPR